MPSRRRLLGLVAAGLLPAAGCLSVPSDADDTDPATTEPPATTTEREPVRGGAAEVSVERTITDDDVQYVESNDTVRYPSSSVGDEVAEYDHMSFDEWAHYEAASVAAASLRSLLNERLPAAESLTVPVSSRGEQDGQRLEVVLNTHLDRDGDVISEPSVARSEVVRATPHSVDATIHLAGQTYTETYPVYVTERTVKNA